MSLFGGGILYQAPWINPKTIIVSIVSPAPPIPQYCIEKSPGSGVGHIALSPGSGVGCIALSPGSQSRRRIK